MVRASLVVAIAVLSGCGGKKADNDPKETKRDAGPAPSPTVAPLATPTLGIDQVRRTNFIYGDGATAHGKAVQAYGAKPRSWAGVKEHAEAAIAKDANHLDAHWLLGIALAQAGEHASAVQHLVTALAADFWRYGALLRQDADLAEFLKTQHGTAVTELVAKIQSDYTARTNAGLWIVARRSPFRWADKPGVQTTTSRGEVYAFDREKSRYLRLTHTDHQVAGFVKAPAGNEVIVVGFDKVDHPKDPEAPSLLARAWVQVYDAADWGKPLGPRATVGTAVREIAVGFGEGGQVLVVTAPASGRWGTGAPTTQSLDKTAGKLVAVQAAAPAPRIVFSLDEGRVVRAADGVSAAWSGEPPAAPALTLGGKPIGIPEGKTVSQASVAVSPDKAFVAFATAGDPCAKGNAPSLYVHQVKTNASRHLLSASSRFATRWVDATTLAYDDGEGVIRLWDAPGGHELLKLDNKAGVALDVLSLTSTPICKQAPPVVEPAAGSGSNDELPPEEGRP
ncbi:MAG: hypothetical protein KF773_31925 [Deltaproteobacteria bacterium]|nr:hypothetical protein [Deltaproteobacteria bacterium]